MARLYVVGTPIGNLEDITLRAKRILGSVAVIACEDTRVTAKLLAAYDLKVPLVSVHHHSASSVLDRLLDRVASGEDVAVVTDAGMPGLADPGGKLVARAIERGLNVESVPGPSALTTATSISGLPTDRFLFLGFLPHKKGRQTAFSRIVATDEAVILYESPHRLEKTLASLVEVLPPARLVAVCRELTKIHEQVIRGSAAEVQDYYRVHPDEVRGEVVIIIGPSA